jgi:hypothetical protein
MIALRKDAISENTLSRDFIRIEALQFGAKGELGCEGPLAGVNGWQFPFRRWGILPEGPLYASLSFDCDVRGPRSAVSAPDVHALATTVRNGSKPALRAEPHRRAGRPG